MTITVRKIYKNEIAEGVEKGKGCFPSNPSQGTGHERLIVLKPGAEGAAGRDGGLAPEMRPLRQLPGTDGRSKALGSGPAAFSPSAS